ncbi:MAG: NAD(P)-dependent oxidoreductase [Planctomycetes bacterium]|nr:NAD(P)-dependent oxidoreductase [Planctomycetota bacterium]
MQANLVLITGAAGNVGGKVRRHLEGRYRLRLLDRDARGDPEVVRADLSAWDESWVQLFQGVDAVVHLAADPVATRTWSELVGPNMDAVFNVLLAAVRGGVKRVIYASSNHAMGGYREIHEPAKITTDLPPLPGTHYVVKEEVRNSTPYGSAKLMGERVGKCFAEACGLSFIAVRIGWVLGGENRASDIPADRDDWFRLMWLSNRDLCHLMERCIEADSSIRYAVVNGMSANTGMRWDIDHTRRLVGYQPQDDVLR